MEIFSLLIIEGWAFLNIFDILAFFCNRIKYLLTRVNEMTLSLFFLISYDVKIWQLESKAWQNILSIFKLYFSFANFSNFQTPSENIFGSKNESGKAFLYFFPKKFSFVNVIFGYHTQLSGFKAQPIFCKNKNEITSFRSTFLFRFFF